MARYVNTVTTGAGTEKMIGGRGRACGETHIRGWDAGVKVVPNTRKGERDSFEIYMTGGSHAAHMNVRLGTVTDTPNGPVFEPAPSVIDQNGANLS